MTSVARPELMVLREPEISEVRAREVLDCRGLPTVQVDVVVDGKFLGRADVPAGRSRGRHEPAEVRDGGSRFGGFGVRRAVSAVRDVLAPALVGSPAVPQRQIDLRLVELDGTSDRSHLGANALLGVSLATARAVAAAAGQPLYRHLNADAHVLPVPQVNLINGGKHASNELDIQEFILMPVGVTTFADALAVATEVNLVLREILAGRYGQAAVNVGDEGGFAPPISEPVEALEQLHLAVDRAGHSDVVVYALDCAASHFYDPEREVYVLAGKPRTTQELMSLYESLARDWGVVSFEDPFHEDDFAAFAELTSRIDAQIVGDDLLVTNRERVERAQELGAANALLLKVNQAGTLSEALAAARQAVQGGWSIVVSERSGETEDPLIADLTVGLNTGQIKTGAPVRGERTAKYNRLLQIEEELGPAAVYAGRSYRHPR
jgi:enolase